MYLSLNFCLYFFGNVPSPNSLKPDTQTQVKNNHHFYSAKKNLPPFPVLIFATCALESIQQVDRGRRRCRLFVTINQVGTKRVLQICTKRPLHQQHQAPTSWCGAPKHQSAKAPKHQSGPKSTFGILTSPAGTNTFVK